MLTVVHFASEIVALPPTGAVRFSYGSLLTCVLFPGVLITGVLLTGVLPSGVLLPVVLLRSQISAAPPLLTKAGIVLSTATIIEILWHTI